MTDTPSGYGHDDAMCFIDPNVPDPFTQSLVGQAEHAAEGTVRDILTALEATPRCEPSEAVEALEWIADATSGNITNATAMFGKIRSVVCAALASQHTPSKSTPAVADDVREALDAVHRQMNYALDEAAGNDDGVAEVKRDFATIEAALTERDEQVRALLEGLLAVKEHHENLNDRIGRPRENSRTLSFVYAALDHGSTVASSNGAPEE